MDRRIAKRVAQTLHGSTVGGKKRHNFFRDDMWNMRPWDLGHSAEMIHWHTRRLTISTIFNDFNDFQLIFIYKFLKAWNGTQGYLPGFKWHMLKEGVIYDQHLADALSESLN